MATIQCTDCGADRRQAPKNTRYCKLCRLIRSLDYWRHNVRKCRNCRGTFAPLDRHDYLCWACNPGLTTRSITCAICKAENVHPALTFLPVCNVCARDPEKRKKLLAALERGQRKRAAQNHNPEEAP